MALKLKCKDYGFECNFNIEGKFSESQVKLLKEHFEEKHGNWLFKSCCSNDHE